MFIPVDLLPRADSVPNTHDISYAAAANTTVLASAEPAQSGHKFLDIDVSTLYLILALCKPKSLFHLGISANLTPVRICSRRHRHILLLEGFLATQNL